MAGTSQHYAPCVTAAVVNAKGEMVAGVIFHDYDAKAGVIQCSAAALTPKWCTRGVLGELMDYVFRVNDCQMLVGRTHEDNAPVRKLWKALGAVEYIIPRLRGRTASEALLCVTDDAWQQSRLNEARHGQSTRSTGAP
jgi:RimJ/RimL family protein N-acetyltransferase